MNTRITIFKTAAEMDTAYPLFTQLYPTLTQKEFTKALTIKIPQGYEIAALYDTDELVAVCGFWIGHRFYCQNFLQMDNFIVAPLKQRKGYGEIMVNWFKSHAKKHHCDRIILDTLIDNTDAHRFFEREGFVIRGYHMNYTL